MLKIKKWFYIFTIAALVLGVTNNISTSAAKPQESYKSKPKDSSQQAQPNKPVEKGGFIIKLKNQEKGQNFNSLESLDLKLPASSIESFKMEESATKKLKESKNKPKFAYLKVKDTQEVKDLISYQDTDKKMKSKGLEIDAFTKQLKSYLESSPNVESVSYSLRKEMDLVPNDTYYPKLWHLNNTVQIYPTPDGSGGYEETQSGTAGADAKAQTGWDYDTTNGGQNAVVAIVDTGIDYTNPDLVQNLWVNQGEIPAGLVSAMDTLVVDGYVSANEILNYCQTYCTDVAPTNGVLNFQDVLGGGLTALENSIDEDGNGYVDDIIGWDFGEGDNNPFDTYGHGTHVSGIAAGVGNNSLGITGIAYGAKIMTVKIEDNYSIADDYTLADSLDYATDNGADTINMSWGGLSTYENFSDDPVYLAIQNAVDNGLIPVASSGNDDYDFSYYNDVPANYDNVISASATNSDDQVTWFTNFGPGSDIASPGEDILSTKSYYASGAAYNTYYTTKSGTSMSAPLITGAATLVKANRPTYDFNDFSQLVKTQSDDLGDTGFDEYYGYGRLNLEKLLNNSITGNYPEASIASHYHYDEITGLVNFTSEMSSDVTSWTFDYTSNLTGSWTNVSSGSSPTSTLKSNFDSSVLTAGNYYYFRLQSTNSSGNQSEQIIKLLVKLDDCGLNNWLASYDDYVIPTIRQCEAAIDHDWGAGSPFPGFDDDLFDVVWTGEFAFAGGDYTFEMDVDNMMSFWIDDVFVGERTSTGTYHINKNIPAGNHTIRVVYTELVNNAKARFRWFKTAPTLAISTLTPTPNVGDNVTITANITNPEALNIIKVTYYNVPGNFVCESAVAPYSCQINNISQGVYEIYAVINYGYDNYNSAASNHIYITAGSPRASLSPIYRFWSDRLQAHFYTISAAERDLVIATWPDVWNYFEGPVFSGFSTAEPGSSPVYRFWSDKLQKHFYTISTAERDMVMATWPDVWSYEGIVYYAYPYQSPKTTPVYRFWSDSKQGHFYTTSAAERDMVIATWPDVWNHYEGIVYWVPFN